MGEDILGDGGSSGGGGAHVRVHKSAFPVVCCMLRSGPSLSTSAGVWTGFHCVVINQNQLLAKV